MSIVGPGAKRALAAASLKTSTGTTTTSNGVPELIRAMMLGVESKMSRKLVAGRLLEFGRERGQRRRHRAAGDNTEFGGPSHRRHAKHASDNQNQHQLHGTAPSFSPRPG